MRLPFLLLSRHQHRVHFERMLSYWMSINSLWDRLNSPLSLCCQASTRKSSTCRDILTGLPYMQKLCTLTRNAFPDKKKGGIYWEASAVEEHLCCLFLSLLSMYALSWRSFPADMNAARVFCIHTFSQLGTLRENSAISSTSPVGNRVCEIAVISCYRGWLWLCSTSDPIVRSLFGADWE